MKILSLLKTPDNVDELKEKYKDFGLVYYTPLEELINTITHLLGSIGAILFFVFMMIKSSSVPSYIASVITCLLIGVEYLISSIYHGMIDMPKKLLWRKIDFPAVCLNVIACATTICVIYGNTYGYIAIALSLSIATIMFVMCALRFDIWRKISVGACFVIGALMFAQFFIVYLSPTGIDPLASKLYLAGLILCLIGAALFGIHKRYVHCIFHVFVLAGPMLFLGASYVLIG